MKCKEINAGSGAIQNGFQCVKVISVSLIEMTGHWHTSQAFLHTFHPPSKWTAGSVSTLHPQLCLKKSRHTCKRTGPK